MIGPTVPARVARISAGVARRCDAVASLVEHQGASRACRRLTTVRLRRLTRPVADLHKQVSKDHADFAEFLVKAGIDSISLTPDRILDVRKRIATIEHELGLAGSLAAPR